MQKSLEGMGLSVISGERVYIPTTVIPVSKDFLETIDKMSEKLDLHPDIIKYYFNVEPEGS